MIEMKRDSLREECCALAYECDTKCLSILGDICIPVVWCTNHADSPARLGIPCTSVRPNRDGNDIRRAFHNSHASDDNHLDKLLSTENSFLSANIFNSPKNKRKRKQMTYVQSRIDRPNLYCKCIQTKHCICNKT